MRLDTDFRGRVVQVTEALSYQDAVSDHLLELHQLLLSLGLNSEIYTKWHDERLAHRRKPIEEMIVDERDVVIFHFCGRSEHALKRVTDSYCTRIIQYHNVTPAEFFDPASTLHQFCVEGRRQLKESLGAFHYFWADSQYNLEELLALGADPERSAVVPIVVPATTPPSGPESRQSGQWLFLGRVAPNKAQVELVKQFALARRLRPDLARQLVLAGGFDEEEPYMRELRSVVKTLNVEAEVKILGKVSDAEKERLYSTSSVYTSLSEHEGFGVPLIEAALHGLPVVALGMAAVPETLGHGPGLVDHPGLLWTEVQQVLERAEYRGILMDHQRRQAARFSPMAVKARLAAALRAVLPKRGAFRSVSVVICTYNRRSYLERVFEYLRDQRRSSFEVIVVDGPSDDGTKELLSRHSHAIKLAHNPQRNLSISRNLGIELADGDIVAFIDDDALPFSDWIEQILSEYNARPLTTAGLGGPAYYAGTFWFQAQDNGINRFAEAKVNIATADIGTDGWFRYNTGTNATFVTEDLRRCGGFDEQFDYYLDESELCFRLQQRGRLIGYAPSVIVRHEFAQSHNRQGRLNYNWFTICKNTAYFVAAYSGLSGDELRAYLDRRMRTERLQMFDDALQRGEITVADRERYENEVVRGVQQGLDDAGHFPRLRALAQSPGRFRPYPVTYSQVGARQLHICIISREFPPFAAGGGVGTLYYHLASELLLLGHRVTAIVPGGKADVFQQGRITVHFTPEVPLLVENADPGFVRNLSWSATAFAKLASICKHDPIDIVESALWDTEALAVALLPPARRPAAVVRLVTPYALAAKINEWNPDPATQALFMSAERALIAAADAVVPISESIARSVEATYAIRRDDRWTKVPCGIAYWPAFDVNQGYDELPQLAGMQELLGKGKLVLFVGRLERRKGIDIILRAAPTFLGRHPEARLVLAGRDVEGWASRLHEFVQGELAERVHFVGEVDNATREKLLSRAYCLLFPSRYESFGLVPLEGFVHGVPVIAARAGAIPEVVQEGASGLLFAAEQADGLAEAADRLLADEGLRRRMSEAALARVRELSGRRSALASVELYNRLVATTSAGRAEGDQTIGRLTAAETVRA
jgi:glycosyltransferase involved in cell wall biosynthesis